MYLITPADDDEPFRVTPDVTAPALQIRDWIRGVGLLPGDDRQQCLKAVPAGEFEEIAGVLFPSCAPASAI